MGMFGFARVRGRPLPGWDNTTVVRLPCSHAPISHAPALNTAGTLEPLPGWPRWGVSTPRYPGSVTEVGPLQGVELVGQETLGRSSGPHLLEGAPGVPQDAATLTSSPLCAPLPCGTVTSQHVLYFIVYSFPVCSPTPSLKVGSHQGRDWADLSPVIPQGLEQCLE